MEGFGELFGRRRGRGRHDTGIAERERLLLQRAGQLLENSFIDAAIGRRTAFHFGEFHTRQVFVRAGRSQRRHLVIEEAFASLRDLQVRFVYFLDADEFVPDIAG